MFAWLAGSGDSAEAAKAIAMLPPPARLIYRAVWKPRYQRTRRW